MLGLPRFLNTLWGGAKLLWFASAAAVVVLFPLWLLAAGQGPHPRASFPAFMLSLLPYWVNFAIYVSVLYLILRKPLRRLWTARRVAIKDHVTRAAQALQMAEQQLTQAQARQASLMQALRELRREIEQETEIEIGRILSEARQRIENIARQADESALAERKTAEKVVLRQMAASAVEKARSKLQQEITPEKDRSIRLAACMAAGDLTHWT